MKNQGAGNIQHLSYTTLRKSGLFLLLILGLTGLALTTAHADLSVGQVSFSVSPVNTGNGYYINAVNPTITVTINDPGGSGSVYGEIDGLPNSCTNNILNAGSGASLTVGPCTITAGGPYTLTIFAYDYGNSGGDTYLNGCTQAPCSGNTISTDPLSVVSISAMTLTPTPPPSTPENYSNGSTWGDRPFTIGFTNGLIPGAGVSAYARWTASDNLGDTACSGGADICDGATSGTSGINCSNSPNLTFFGYNALSAADGRTGVLYLDLCTTVTGGATNPALEAYTAIPFDFAGPAPTVTVPTLSSPKNLSTIGSVATVTVNAPNTISTFNIDWNTSNSGLGTYSAGNGPTGSTSGSFSPSQPPPSDGLWYLTAQVTDNADLTSPVAVSPNQLLYDNTSPLNCVRVINTSSPGGTLDYCLNSSGGEAYSACTGTFPAGFCSGNQANNPTGLSITFPVNIGFWTTDSPVNCSVGTTCSGVVSGDVSVSGTPPSGITWSGPNGGSYGAQAPGEEYDDIVGNGQITIQASDHDQAANTNDQTWVLNINNGGPAPTISNLTPANGIISTSISVQAQGSGFAQGTSTLYWGATNGTPISGGEPTGTAIASTVSGNILTALVSATVNGTAGTIYVDVCNNTGGTPVCSNQKSITITTAAPPQLLSITPETAEVGSGPVGFTANGGATGSNYTANSVIELDGSPIDTGTNASQFATGILTASLDNTTLGTSAHTFQVTVCNGSNCSSPLSFTVTAKPTPTITGFSPASGSLTADEGVLAGGAGFTLTVTGSNFIATDVLNWGSNALTQTGSGSDSAISFAIPGSLAIAGTQSLTVQDPSGSPTSSPVSYTINSPTAPNLLSLSPNSTMVESASGAGVSVNITGNNFIDSTCSAQWNGAAVQTVYGGTTMLTAQIPASDLTSATVAQIGVACTSNHTTSPGTLPFTVTSQPVPTINLLTATPPGLQPSNVTEGSPQFNLTITGTNYTGNDIVNFGSHQVQPNSGATSTQMVITVQASWVAVGSGGTTVPVTVQDTSTGNTSNSVLFTINPQGVPSIITLNPASATVGDPQFLLTINGSNFSSGTITSIAQWNGGNVATTFINNEQLTITVTTTMLGTTGTNIPVVVCNGASNCSSPVDFTVLAKNAPTITSLSPSSVTEGNGAFTLQVNGTNFVPGAFDLVQWNGTALFTEYVSATELIAQVPAQDVAIGTGGSIIPITVEDTSVGGQTSAQSPFLINALPTPDILSLSPSSATVSSLPFNMTVTGSNFVSGLSTIEWAGTALPTSFLSSTELTANINFGSLGITSPESVNVTVCNNANCSQPAVFEVVVLPDHAPLSVTWDTNAADNADLSFTVDVRPNPIDTNPAPSYVHLTFQYPDETVTGQMDDDSCTSSALTITNGVMSFPCFPSKTNPGNTHYTNIQATVGNSSSLSDPSWSPATPSTLPSAVNAWTLPTAPGSAYLNAVPNNNSIAATINFPTTNSNQTYYEIQMVQNPSDFPPNNSLTDPVQNSNEVQIGQTPAPVSNLTPLAPYYIQTLVISNSPYPSFNVTSPVGGPITTGAPPVSGNVINSSSNTITALWSTPVSQVLANVTQLEAGATQATVVFTSSSDIITSPFPVTLPDITLYNLPLANTSYTLTLQALVNGNSTLSILPGSQAIGYTLAATPPTPQVLLSSSSTEGIVLNVEPAGDSYNASDSSYTFLVSVNGQSPQYLDGSGGLTPTLSSANSKPLSQWPASIPLNNLQLATTYYVWAAVWQTAPSTMTWILSSPNSITSPGGDIGVSYPAINGVTLDDYLFGAGLASPFTAQFSTDIDTSTLFNSPTTYVTLTEMGTQASVPFTLSFPNSQTMTVTPTNTLLPATLYQLSIAAGIPDYFHIGATAQPFNEQFYTSLNPTDQSTVYSPYDTTQADGVTVPAGALGQSGGWFVVPRTKLVSPPNYETASIATVQSAEGANQNLVTVSQVEVLIYANPTGTSPILSNAASPISLTMAERSGAGGGASPNAAAVDPNSLHIYYVNTANGSVQLVAQPGQSTAGSVTAQIQNSGVYVLAGTVSTSLSSAYAYPVPYKPSAGHTVINFVNLAANSTVRIFTITGELVNTLTNGNNDSIQWNVQNSDGKNVASGVYIYEIKNNFSQARGKLIVIR